MPIFEALRRTCQKRGADESHEQQGHWNRPRHHQLGGGDPGERRAERHHQRGGGSDHAVGGRLRQGRGAVRRPGRQAPGRDEPREHRLLDQALHGPQVRRGRRRAEDGALQGRGGRQRRRPRPGAGQALLAPRGLGHDPAEDEAGRRGLPRREGDEGGHHRPRLLQRLPAPGHQGRGQDRRASRSCASSTSPPRPRSPTASTRRRTRPSRSTTSAAAPSTSPSSRSARGWSRSRPRTATPTSAATTSTSGSSTGSSRSSRRTRASTCRQGQDGPAASQGGGGEGEVRALHHPGDRDQPALRHRGRERPQAPGPEAHPGQAGAAGGRPAGEVHGAGAPVHEGRGGGAQGHRRGGAGGRARPASPRCSSS